jgi:hypothetical protein
MQPDIKVTARLQSEPASKHRPLTMGGEDLPRARPSRRIGGIKDWAACRL